ncbi:hypothetical protein FPV67DRAFT_1681016 [Lyophyllum atratum]|nr:hypothetical protein FPV67DRAFT_1681016 [Lyophyllum atratum]
MVNPPRTPLTSASARHTTPRLGSGRKKQQPSAAEADENDPPTLSARPIRAKGRSTQGPPLQDKVNEDAAVLQALVSRVASLEQELTRERAEKDDLAKDLAEAKDAAMTGLEDDETPNNRELLEQLEAIEEELEEERRHSMELEQQVQEQLALSEARNAPGNDDVADGTILRPKGTAGQEWGIQMAMGLGGSTRKNEFYKGIQRQLRDLSISAQLNWELEWANIPTVDKAKFFCVAREKIKFLKRFRNDWATEEIVKQYFKNKRKNHYKNGWLDVPERYKYLKDTSAKRDQAGSRVKRVKAARDAAHRNTRRPGVAGRHREDSEDADHRDGDGDGDGDVDMED